MKIQKIITITLLVVVLFGCATSPEEKVIKYMVRGPAHCPEIHGKWTATLNDLSNYWLDKKALEDLNPDQPKDNKTYIKELENRITAFTEIGKELDLCIFLTESW